jgi:hypothetical protein
MGRHNVPYNEIAIDVVREHDDDADDDNDNVREDGSLGERIALQLITRSAWVLNFLWEGLLGV